MSRFVLTAAAAAFLGLSLGAADPVLPGELCVRLSGPLQVARLGALRRWNTDGTPRTPLDPNARIDEPAWDATARRRHSDQAWVFADLQPGCYDLVILGNDRVRIEGFHYPPLLEFDEFWRPGNTPPESVATLVRLMVPLTKQFENKVAPLHLAGDEKHVRVLVQLLRDKPTSFDGPAGEPVATLRHEVWQYTNFYGGWAKEKRTRVLDRVIMPRRLLSNWTWIWDPRLGGIEVAADGKHEIDISLPTRLKRLSE